MTIMKNGDRLGAGDGRGPAGAANYFGDGRRRDIFSTRDFISFLDDRCITILERVARIDLGTVFAVGEQTVSVGINAGRDSGAIHVGSRGINGVMMAEGDALPGESPKRGSITLGDGVGAHAVPDDHDDVTIVRRGLCFAKNGSGEEGR